MANLSQRSRLRGALLGLAVGDAVGTTLEFQSPGTFEPISDMVGGGPFGLEPGQWTDDTSMALCLAESLIERKAFDPGDQMQRYVRWWRTGHLSSNTRCFDIGNTVRQALAAFERSGEPFVGSTNPRSAGNGSLMRLAPVAIAFHDDPPNAVRFASESSRTTHGAETCIDACRYFAGLLIGAFQGASRDELVSKRFAPAGVDWNRNQLHSEIDEIASGSFRKKEPPEIRGSGFVVRSLEAALWAFHRSSSFRDGCLLAANLGDDADTTAAIYGQIAGAFHGEEGIPAEWLERLTMREKIGEMAEALADLTRSDI